MMKPETAAGGCSGPRTVSCVLSHVHVSAAMSADDVGPGGEAVKLTKEQRIAVRQQRILTRRLKEGLRHRTCSKASAWDPIVVSPFLIKKQECLNQFAQCNE